MNVSLTPELEQFVSAKVETGRYNSASEVVREALRLLEEHDQARASQLAGFNRQLGRRLASLDRGEHVDPEEARMTRCAKHHAAIYALLFESCPRSRSMRSRQIVSPMPLAMPNPVIVAHRAAGSFILSVANMPTIRLAM